MAPAGGAPVAAALLLLLCCQAAAGLVDEREAEALAVGAEEAVRKYRAESKTATTKTTTTNGHLSRLQSTLLLHDVDTGGDDADRRSNSRQRTKATATATTGESGTAADGATAGLGAPGLAAEEKGGGASTTASGMAVVWSIHSQ